MKITQDVRDYADERGNHFGSLFAEATDQPQLELLPTSETQYHIPAINAQVTFVGDCGAPSPLEAALPRK